MVPRDQQLSSETSLLLGLSGEVYRWNELTGQPCIRSKSHHLTTIRLVLQHVRPLDSLQPEASASPQSPSKSEGPI